MAFLILRTVKTVPWCYLTLTPGQLLKWMRGMLVDVNVDDLMVVLQLLLPLEDVSVVERAPIGSPYWES